MYILLTVLIVLILALLLRVFLKEREFFKASGVFTLISILCILFIVTSLIGMIFIHSKERNQNALSSLEVNKAIIEARLSRLSAEERLDEEDRALLDRTVNRVDKFNNDIIKMRNLRHSPWTGWYTEDYCDDIDLIILDKFDCYTRFYLKGDAIQDE